MIVTVVFVVALVLRDERSEVPFGYALHLHEPDSYIRGRIT